LDQEELNRIVVDTDSVHSFHQIRIRDSHLLDESEIPADDKMLPRNVVDLGSYHTTDVPTLLDETRQHEPLREESSDTSAHSWVSTDDTMRRHVDISR
jgi:hypothetical protein